VEPQDPGGQPPYPGPQERPPYQGQEEQAYPVSQAQSPYPRQEGQPPHPGPQAQPQYRSAEPQAQYPDPYIPSAKDSQGAASGFLEKIKSLPLKKILLVAVPVLVLIIAAIIIIPLLFGPGSSTLKDSIVLLGDGDEIIVSGNNNVKFTIDGRFESAQRSLDSSKAAVMTDLRGSSGGALWFVTTSKATKIADDVLTYRLSDSGSAVAYLTDYDSRNSVAVLYLYDAAKGSSTKIADDAMYAGGVMTGVSISPDGKTVTYIGDYDSRNNEYTSYIKVGARTAEKIDDNVYCVAVSNGGTTMYYVKVSGRGVESLHVKSGRSENRLISEISSPTTLWLNKDYTQVVFNQDERANISKNGGERERLYNRTIRDFLLPRGTQTRGGAGGGRVVVSVVGIRSLTPLVGITSDGIVYIDNKYESNRISSSSDNPYRSVVSANGRKLLFITNNGHLASIDPTKPGADRSEVGRNVARFVASSDASTVYFVNEDNELYYVRGNGAPSKVADDVDGQLAMQWNSTRAFFIVDDTRSGGELYFSNNGGARAKVSGGDDVVGIMTTPASVFFRRDGQEIFRSSGNEKFTKFAEDVNVLWATG